MSQNKIRCNSYLAEFYLYLHISEISAVHNVLLFTYYVPVFLAKNTKGRDDEQIPKIGFIFS